MSKNYEIEALESRLKYRRTNATWATIGWAILFVLYVVNYLFQKAEASPFAKTSSLGWYLIVGALILLLLAVGPMLLWIKYSTLGKENILHIPIPGIPPRSNDQEVNRLKRVINELESRKSGLRTKSNMIVDAFENRLISKEKYNSQINPINDEYKQLQQQIKDTIVEIKRRGIYQGARQKVLPQIRQLYKLQQQGVITEAERLAQEDALIKSKMTQPKDRKNTRRR